MPTDPGPAAREQSAWIPMRDGVRLAASLYLPAEQPAPVLLEALPYRKDDLTAGAAAEYRRWRDEYGYAVARLDLRGTGSSEGVATDEYPPQERSDLREVMAWLASQPWCTGRVGMFGTSYSAFNSLQLAADPPPELAAVTAIYGSDDRYADDVHYHGGALKLLDCVDYPLYMVAMNALPPVPAPADDQWWKRWRERVAGAEPWLLRWLAEPSDGPYWRAGSVRADYRRVAVPVFLVAGWADGYRNTSLRTVAGLRVPARLLAGPWSHAAPEQSLPGPGVDLVAEMAAWWGHWLRGAGGSDGGPLDVFVRTAPAAPEPDLASHPGHWRRLAGWPAPGAGERVLALGTGAVELAVRPDVGTAGWISCAGALPWGQPLDQRRDDALSVVTDWPVADPVVVVGQPVLRLRVVADEPVAFLSAKLCDVGPDGTSALVTRGVLNLCHRHGAERPERLVPGEPVDVALELETTAWCFEPGHAIRLSLAGSDWPNTVAPPRPVTLVLHRDGGNLTLPVLDGPPGEPPRLAPSPPAPPPAAGVAEAVASGPRQPPVSWRVVDDVLARRTECITGYGSVSRLADGTAVHEHYDGWVGVDRRSFEQWATATARYELAWPSATAVSEARLELRLDSAAIDVRLDLTVTADGKQLARRHWSARYDREFG